MRVNSDPDARVAAWLAALDARHLSDLTPAEVARALRALSSCYVERRRRLAEGGAFAGAGKRAAFALYYAPAHFFTVRAIVCSLPPRRAGVSLVYDLGCGTGAAGAAWAIESPGARLVGADRSPWAVAEANWTYRQLGLRGRAVHQDVLRVRMQPSEQTAVVAAYVANEVPDRVRTVLLGRLLEAAGRGARVLVVEPIARRLTPWWRTWAEAFASAGGRADEWRVPARLPERQRLLAKAAGLDARELTARTLFLDRLG